ncbi:hypothetical protein HNP37_000806 [Flavobacterium nitrogenifigens]|uniref:Uncharacterized protein n=2 Tax=Flavobacterium TaxID=237 RepID=A0A7W7IUF1_9FLAO|nr:hypothetical protein [Flavobacterium nitrogenifigens]MBB6385485.1 hypothetical protein [Flavobacterium notoginsengisoli]
MYIKKPLYHLLIRIGIFALLFIGIFAYSSYTYDPNPYNRHLNPKIGFFGLAFFLIQAYSLFLLLEMIYFFMKKHKNLAFINLAFLIIIEIAPVLVLLQLFV